jgi:hypothetical protein
VLLATLPQLASALGAGGMSGAWGASDSAYHIGCTSVLIETLSTSGPATAASLRTVVEPPWPPLPALFEGEMTEGG